jgi:acetyl-CoA acetyltransferase
VVLVAVADSLRSGLSGSGAVESLAEAGHAEFELPHGIHIPAMFSLIARRHMIECGTTSEHLAAVAVTMRHHASMNPNAQMREPITVADVLASKVIADPLHILDCSLVSDAGGAVVLTSVERAKALKKKPAYILGYGEAHDGEHVTQLPDLTRSGAQRAGEQAYRMAGYGPRDMDVAMLYDCFTISVLLQLESLGFCKRGEAGPFVAEGHCRLGAKLPLNPHGGLLSYAHAGRTGSIFHTVEAVRQLRGESGNRQVPGANLVLVHGLGGAATTHTTLILGSERT